MGGYILAYTRDASPALQDRNDKKVSMKKYIIICLLLMSSVIGIGVYQKYTLHDDKLHIIFCAVGQGDAILIKTPKNKYVLVDGGPDKSVLHCLNRHIPFWQRNLHAIILSHPHADHYLGFHFVFPLYAVHTMMTEAVSSNAEMYKDIVRRATIQYLYAGDSFVLDEVSFIALSPKREEVDAISTNIGIGEASENVSLITRIRYGDFDTLLTGDIPAAALQKAAAESEGSIEVLQSPHHGSKTSMNKDILTQLQPQFIAISVGKNNYGHPHTAVLDMFTESGIPYMRTDQRDDIEIITDGQAWRVKK